MFKKLSVIFMAIILAVVAAACGSSSSKEEASAPAVSEAKELAIKHLSGETKVKTNPKTVVVFDFGTLDTLDKLGVEVTGVPKDNIPTYLEKYKADKYKNAGGLMEPDFEKISEMAPDLIIISGRQAASYDKFAEIAPTINLGLDATKYMESFKSNAETLGKIFNKESVVKEELAKIDETIEEVKEKATASNKNALIVLANDGKVSAYGAGSRFGLIHDVLGVTPVDKNIEVSTHGQSISFEYIVEKNPDYLFVVDRGAVVGGQSSAKQVVENDLVKNTKAFKEGHIVYLNPEYWYVSGGGLVSVTEMVKEIEKNL